jgi:hypothetical protein
VALDEALSANRSAGVGRALQLSALAAVVVGIFSWKRSSSIDDELASGVHPRAELDSMLASRRRYQQLRRWSFISAPILFTIGNVTIATGNPRHRPESPADLPAVEVD